MQPGIDGQKMAVLSGLQTVHSQLSSAIQGSYKGQAVAVIPGSNTATVQDSLEELTFTVSESVSKKLADRTTQSKSFSARLHALMAKYVTAIPESLSPEELSQYADWIRKQAQLNLEGLRQLLEEKFGDDAESQVAALELLDELFSEEPESPGKATIRGLKDQWRQDETRGPLLRAGENIAVATKEFAGDIASDVGLRTFYRSTVLGWGGLDDVYTSILGQYSGKSFDTATDFLIRALGCEIQSFGPSCDPRLLAAVRDDIYYMQVVRRLYQQLNELAERLESTFEIKLCNPKTRLKQRRKSSAKYSR